MTTKINICGGCGGERLVRVSTFLHRTEQNHDMCPSCLGSGRVVHLSYNLTVPFTVDREDIKLTDAAIKVALSDLNKTEAAE